MKVVSICLTDLPVAAITKSEKNGKKYISLVVDDKKETDQYGNDVTVYVNQSKEDREAKVARTYVGQGKNIEFKQQGQTATKPASATAAQSDDLPW